MELLRNKKAAFACELVEKYWGKTGYINTKPLDKKSQELKT